MKKALTIMILFFLAILTSCQEESEPLYKKTAINEDLILVSGDDGWCYLKRNGSVAIDTKGNVIKMISLKR